MALLRSERFSALLLLSAALIGLTFANSPIGPGLVDLRDVELGIAGTGFSLTLGHWATDGLLAVFFFIAAIELRHEVRHGELDTPRKALVPVMGAIGGVVVPASIYLLIAGRGEYSTGWPIPTATDIAFALGVLAIAGRGLPPRIRALLLALAVLDDLIAILIIAFVFTSDLQVAPLLGALPVVAAFAIVSRLPRVGHRPPVIAVLVILGVTAWTLVYLSGVHATIAGVALGLVMGGSSATRARHVIEPWSNLAILPVFAFVAALVPLPTSGIDSLSPVFWGILVALPLGKLIGITGGALVANMVIPKQSGNRIDLGDAVAVAALGGIGFTVSLLMNELAFESSRELASEGTLAVIGASIIAAILGNLLVLRRARFYRGIHRAA